jgi:hypothetical protein
MPQLGEQCSAFFLMPDPAKYMSYRIHRKMKRTIQLTTSMFLCSMHVVSVESGDDKYVIYGTVRDIRSALDAFQKEILHQIEQISGPSDRLLYNELKIKLDEMLKEQLLADEHYFEDEPSICQLFIDIYLHLNRMGYKAFPEKAKELMSRLLNGDVVPTTVPMSCYVMHLESAGMRKGYATSSIKLDIS